MTYIRFNVGSVPAGTIISQATLKVYVIGIATAGSFYVEPVVDTGGKCNTTWTEATLNSAATTEQPCLGASIAGPIAVTTANQYILIPITATVQDWINGQPNYGIALVADFSAGKFSATFDSKENAGTSHPPELDIAYEGGSSGGITGVTTGSSSGLTSGVTSGNLNLSLESCGIVGEILQWNGTGWACSPMSLSNEFVPLTGGTMTGTLSVPVLSGGGSAGNLSITSATDINVKSGETLELSAPASLTLSSGNSAITMSPAEIAMSGFVDLTQASPVLLGSASANSLSAGSIVAGSINNSTGGITLPPFGPSPTIPLNSQPLIFQGVSPNSSNYPDQPFFQWQLEPAGVNTATPSGTLNLLYGPDYTTNSAPGETGLSIAGSGIIHFASGQTFPGAGGGSTITGVSAGLGLLGGGISGVIPLSVDEQVVAFQSDLSTAVANGVSTAETFATNAAGNAQNNADQYADLVFLPLRGGAMTGQLNVLANGLAAGGNQLVLAGGNVGVGTATPGFTLDVAGTVNAANGFNLGGTVFDSGSPSSNNAFLGFAGNSSNPGTGNTASGWQALAADTTGGSNVASGYSALNSNTSGSFNTALGVFAGQTADSSPLTTNNNTFLGAGSEAANGSISNATAIGSNAVVGANNALVLGSIAGLNSATNNTNVGIGTPTPLATLDVEAPGATTPLVNFFTTSSKSGIFTVIGATNITGSLTVNGQAITGGSGGGGGGTITGVSGINGITGGGTTGNVTLSLATNACGTGTALTALPFTCSPFATLGTNTFLASQAVTGNLIATGTVQGATLNATSGFDFNNALFAYASGTSINDNAYFGFAGLSANQTNPGDSNTAIGYHALEVNGKGNTGGNPLANGANSAVGANALLNNTLGSNNNAVGSGALEFLTTGGSNIAIGNSAGSAFTSSESNNIDIGNRGVVGDSGIIRIGTAGTHSTALIAGNVGIGTLAPAAALDVEAASGTPAVNFFTSSTNPGNFTVNGTATVTNLTVTGSCNGCGSGGSGGGISTINAGTGLTGGGSGSTVSLAVNSSVVPLLAAANTFTTIQTINTIGAYGVSAQSSAATGTGVLGTGNGSGVTGNSSSSTGSGVVAQNFSTSGNAYGVWAASSSSTGTGVLGQGGGAGVTGVSGSGYGVMGQSNGTTSGSS
ncbi:MAG: DNRLRE domain-containing protein, partial [Candidatus Sulfotelmatobacter sp.]